MQTLRGCCLAPLSGPTPRGAFTRQAILTEAKVTQRTSVKGTRTSVRGTQRATKGNAKQTPAARRSQWYFSITGFPFPLGPFFQRDTVRTEVVRDAVWMFEQTQALDFFAVYTPVRMTVIRLKSGGLWVHAPVAPTDECVALLKELGQVEYIVLPTFAYEHKVFVGPFSRRFPKAKVYVAPFQWSFPLNLPAQFFGIFPTGTLDGDGADLPWADEIQQKLLLPPSLGVGDYVRFPEVAFFHQRSRTLLVTDAVVYLEDKPPAVIPEEALLELGRDNFLATYLAGDRSPAEVKALARPEKVDSPENRRKGWQRMALLVLYFNPSDLLDPDPSFRAIANRLFVGPVVETLVYSKVPRTVTQWVDSICSDWQFQRVIPAHFCAPVRAGPAEFRRAFANLYSIADAAEKLQSDGTDAGVPAPAPAPAGPGGLLGMLFGRGGGGGAAARDPPIAFPAADMRVLNSINETLLRWGAVVANAEGSKA